MAELFGLRKVRAEAHSPRARWKLGAALALVVLIAGACGSSAKPAAGKASNASRGTAENTASAPGITKSTITIGLVTSVTGPYSSSFGEETVKALEARFDAVNAQGGIHGRKVNVVVRDDASSPTSAATATQSLISEHVFSIASVSPVFFGGYRATTAANIPVVGIGDDGPEWGDPANTNLFPFPGSFDNDFPTFDSYGKFLKSQGVTKMAVLAYGESPTSQGSAKAVLASAEKAGIADCYSDLSVPIGGVDFTAAALAMKSAGCNGVYMPAVEATDIALVSAVRNAGLPMKAEVFATGYGQATLNLSGSDVQGVDFFTAFTPVDRPNPGVDKELSQLKQYAGITGVPDFQASSAWIAGDLIIAGLDAAGSNPTRTSFEAALRKMSDYDAGGALAGPDNLTLGAIGQADATLTGANCWYVEKLSGSTFHSLSKAPYCGTEIPGTKNS